MDWHCAVYFGLALAYCEASLNSAFERQYHCACREAVIAVLYTILPLVILEPNAAKIGITALVS